jgi:integrase
MYKVAYELIISGDYYLEAEKIEKDVQRYVKSTNHCSVSINTFLTYLNVFVNYCIKKKWIETINIKEDYKKRVYDNEAKIYNEDEIKQLIEYFDKRDSELSLMMQFMLETGARMVDVLTLERKQIKEKEIIWKNKKTKAPEPRPISNKAIEILEKLPERDKIFRWTYAGSSFCSKLLREAFINVGIEQDERSFQEFRSTFRMRLAKKGIPEAYIQYLMRHNKPVTTWKYYTSFEKEFGLKYLNS